MRVIIENDAFRAEIDPLGAELKRLFSKKEARDIVWRGNPEVWNGSSPWLFPVVGRCKDGGFKVNGKKYLMPQHGFAKSSQFTVSQQKLSEAVFSLRESNETMECYPWKFNLSIKYELTDEALKIGVKVENTNDSEMLFSLGAHPGFNAKPGDRLVFETSENIDVRRLDHEHLLETKNDGHFGGTVMSLRPELFDDDAMIFIDPASSAVRVLDTNDHGVRVEFGKVPFLGVWSMAGKGMPYVCIEPWFGADDSPDFNGDIAAKNGIQTLAIGAVFEMNLAISPV